ncbi:MAG: diguanylate phosphodiesterase [Pseudonocardiales bacterium]|nr:diguanylate phosphodiesterase [Pseudonocardiales bacterium]
MSVIVGYSESDRLAALAQTRLMDTDPESEFDTIVELAARLLGTPMASVSLLDDEREFFKAKVGFQAPEVPRSESMCTLAVSDNRPLVDSDARLDSRFADLKGVRAGIFVAYAGVPIAGRDGLPLGTLCVFDTEPRLFDLPSMATLTSLAQLVSAHLDLRRRDVLAGVEPSTARVDAEALRDAMDQGQLRVFYQPIVDLMTGGVHSVEALVRWQHPVRGLLAPDAFLPLAEVAGMGPRIDRWVLQSAVSEVALWRQWLPEVADLGVGVNVGLGRNVGADWAEDVLGVLASSGLDPSALTLEVTERSLDGASSVSWGALESLVEQGCGVSIDDIGTGTSSLARLVELPATQVKIDREFVHTMAEDRRRAAVVGTLARLGNQLNLDVVAEGVEDVGTARLVTEAGCSLGQGYLWSPPVSSEQVLDLILDMTAVQDVA